MLKIAKTTANTVTLTYGVFKPGETLEPSGRQRVRFKLDGTVLTRSTPFRASRTVPAPHQLVSLSKTEEELMELSYASGTSSTPLLGDTIGDNLDRTIARFGDREALVSVHQDLRYTYAQFGEAVDRGARAFIAAGIEPGDRVGIWSPNCAEWALVQYGTAKAGIILVNINPAYRTSELAYVLRQSGCRMLVAATRVQDERLRRDGRRGPRRPARRSSRSCSSAATGRSSSPGRSGCRRSELRERQAATQFDDPINIQYTAAPPASRRARRSATTTSSTTATSSAAAARYSEQDRVCIPVPYYHCFGMVMGNLACTSHGACMVIPAPAFDPVATLQAVQDERCTSLYGVPTMFIAELEHPRVRRVRPLVAAHRDHGRLAVPDRDDEAAASTRCTWRR